MADVRIFGYSGTVQLQLNSPVEGMMCYQVSQITGTDFVGPQIYKGGYSRNVARTICVNFAAANWNPTLQAFEFLHNLDSLAVILQIYDSGGRQVTCLPSLNTGDLYSVNRNLARWYIATGAGLTGVWKFIAVGT